MPYLFRNKYPIFQSVKLLDLVFMSECETVALEDVRE